jgi:DNA (cytosine-5)-methyltransferase 1
VVTRPRLLDLFCGAGGAAMGYHRAGFDVVGVDIEEQPHYPFQFEQADALTVLRYGSIPSADFVLSFDAIHASPPCQAYSSTRTNWNARGDHPKLIDPIRALLQCTGLPWVMENVPGAPLCAHLILCGSMFGLTDGEWELRRHRLFELGGFSCIAPPCTHGRPVLGVYGNGGGGAMTRGTKATIDQARRIMGIDWMTMAEISQAIPPAYTEHIGHYLMAEISARAIA